jgi:hypothetical protein
MGSSELKYQAARPASQQDIWRSCREAEMSYHDPTMLHKLHLEIAIAEDRFDDACACALMCSCHAACPRIDDACACASSAAHVLVSCCMPQH